MSLSAVPALEITQALVKLYFLWIFQPYLSIVPAHLAWHNLLQPAEEFLKSFGLKETFFFLRRNGFRKEETRRTAEKQNNKPVRAILNEVDEEISFEGTWSDLMSTGC